MQRIKIFRTPPGEAPEEIRQAWVGLILPTEQTEPRPIHQAGILSYEDAGESLAYAVPTREALAILQSKHPEVAKWWLENKQLWFDTLIFDHSACRMLPSLSNLERNIESIFGAMAVEAIPASALVMVNHTLWTWVELHGMLDRDFEPEDIALVEPFWGLLKTYGIELTEEEKKDIFINFIED